MRRSLLLLAAAVICLAAQPAHAGLALPGAQYVHKTNFNFGLGVAQTYTSATLDLVTSVRPTTIASATVDYRLGGANSASAWSLRTELGQAVRNDTFKVRKAGDWHARAGIYWSFSP